jgi:YcxB-like protein
MRPFEYHFEVTPSLRGSVQRDLIRRSRWYRTMEYGYVVMPLLLVGISLLAGRGILAAVRANLFWLIGLPFLGFVVVPWLNRWSTARVLRSNPALGGAQSIAFTSDGLAMENRAGSSLVRWPTLLRVIEERNHFLFYYTRNCAYYLPRATVPADELPALRAFIDEHVTAPKEFASSRG